MTGIKAVRLPTDECLHKDEAFKKYFYKYASDQAAFFAETAGAGSFANTSCNMSINKCQDS